MTNGIELSSSDTCFERARKMCQYANFNSRGIDRYFAEILLLYQELDKQAFEKNLKKESKE